MLGPSGHQNTIRHGKLVQAEHLDRMVYTKNTDTVESDHLNLVLCLPLQEKSKLSQQKHALIRVDRKIFGKREIHFGSFTQAVICFQVSEWKHQAV